MSNESVRKAKSGDFTWLAVGAMVIGWCIAGDEFKVDGKVMTDRIIAQDKADSKFSGEDLEFTGRFAIARIVKSGTAEKVFLYIGDGDTLRFQGRILTGGDGRKGYRAIN